MPKASKPVKKETEEKEDYFLFFYPASTQSTPLARSGIPAKQAQMAIGDYTLQDWGENGAKDLWEAQLIAKGRKEEMFTLWDDLHNQNISVEEVLRAGGYVSAPKPQARRTMARTGNKSDSDGPSTSAASASAARRQCRKRQADTTPSDDEEAVASPGRDLESSSDDGEAVGRHVLDGDDDVQQPHNCEEAPRKRQRPQRTRKPVVAPVVQRDISKLPHATVILSRKRRDETKVAEVIAVVAHRVVRKVEPNDGDFIARFDVLTLQEYRCMADGIEEVDRAQQEAGRGFTIGEEHWRVRVNKEDMGTGAKDSYWVWQVDMRNCGKLIEDFEKEAAEEYRKWRREEKANARKRAAREQRDRARKDKRDALIVRPSPEEEAEEPVYTHTRTPAERARAIAVENAMDAQSNRRFGTREEEEFFLSDPTPAQLEEWAFYYFSEVEKDQKGKGNRDHAKDDAQLRAAFTGDVRETWIRLATREHARRGNTIRRRREREAELRPGETLEETSDEEEFSDEGEDEVEDEEEEEEEEDEIMILN